MSITSIFPYYGAKSKVAHLYAVPHHAVIMEPFAGSASYAFRYWDHDVWINDLDPRTYSLWCYLISPDAIDMAERHIPDKVVKGQRVSELVDVKAVPSGLVELLRSYANVGTQGTKGVHDVISPFGVLKWPRIKAWLRMSIPRVAKWQVTNLPYHELPDIEATWFVDAPYANAAGDRYRHGASSINFSNLGEWCLKRQGQLIAAENVGADWLPFSPLTPRRLGINSRYQKSSVAEVVYERSDRVRRQVA